MSLWRGARKLLTLTDYTIRDQGRLFSVPFRGKKKKARNASSPDGGGNEGSSGVDLAPFQEKMNRAMEAFSRDLVNIRSAGAHPGMLDKVQVEAYGARTSLRELAQVSLRDARSLQVHVFDSGMTSAVEKAIRGSGLNLNPAVESSEGGRIKVPVPKATRETRDMLQKAASKAAESARVSARNVRRSAMDAVKKAKADLAKDEVKRLEKRVQSFTDDTVDSIDKALREKVKSIG